MMIKVVKDLRVSFGHARDQGQRPTCLACAASDAHAAARNTKLFEALSAEYLFYHAVQRMPQKDPHRGIGLPAATAALETDGQPTEQVWPYLPALPSNLSAWKPPTGGQVYRRETKKESPTADALRRYIANGRPVIAILKLSESFYQPNTRGVIELRDSDPDASMHAILAVGYGVSGTSNMILVRNSWGLQWGLHGYAWLYEQYILPRLRSMIVVK